MTKVYPNIAAASTPVVEKLKSSSLDTADAIVLTVWKKSLLFNCNGFTVYDGSGNLVFRVDNYMAGSGANGEIVLMDADGKPLLTIRRKRLSLGDNWLVYDGETAVNPLFSVRKHVKILNTKSLAHVSGNSSSGSTSNSKNIVYEIEGSYSQRSCAVYDDKHRRVAEIKQKEAVGGVAFGVDVFRLIIGPKMDTSVAMAIVILLDQMFGSSRRFHT
ncbi:protein LURP-one-related 8 [Ricinus communis]|uniref:GTP binding protein, putative n=1 Tax=Ricinus communis TaxID=3988 RepID=B9S1V7_RICCO|nr:protein LURP-one-related 8 [Ricinus communis]EEF42300.1 GTP binding protein, putative [Ricinus communis]|eukprot:XP_002519976.1 protein LURP-one-related 8 [Ricinus communis]